MRALLRLWRDDERGFSVLNVLIAAAIVIGVAASVAGTLVVVSRANAQVALNRSDASQLEAFDTQIRDQSQDGLAVSIPATDVAGVSNADGHAFLVYSRDGNNHPHFSEWVCTGSCTPGSGTGGTLTAYTFTTWSNPASTLKTVGSMSGVTLGASYLYASQIADSAHNVNAPFFAARWAAAGFTAVPDRTVQLGYPDVLGGNRIVVVKIASRSNAYDLHLLPLALPTTGQTVVVGYRPAIPNALTLSPIAAFAVSISPAETSTAAETNYPTTSSYTESDNCAGVATIAPQGSPSGPSAPFSVTPVATDFSGGTCTMTVRDIDGQTASIAIAVGATTHALVVSPQTSFTVAQNTTVQWTATDQSNGAPANVYITNERTDGVAGSSCGGWSPTSSSPSGTTFSGTIVAGTCYVDVVDAALPSSPVTISLTATKTTVLVCNTDPLAGTSNATTIYQGTTAIPPCAPPPTPAPTCPPGYSGSPPDCTQNNQQNPTPTPGCVVGGAAPYWTFTMPATGGTCSMSGTLTLTGSSTYCNPFTFTCRADLVSQTGTDTQGVGAFTLNYDDTASSSVNSYGGWYCFASGPLAGEAGCQGIVVNFATMPNASLPLSVSYVFSNWSHSGTCANIGVNAFVLTAELEAEAKATAQTGTNQEQPYYGSYHTTLLAQGYEPTYNGIDPTAKSFFVTWLPESSQLGTTCTANESFNYTVTVTQGAGPAGVTATGPSGLTIQQ